MKQNGDSGLALNNWPKLLDHYNKAKTEVHQLQQGLEERVLEKTRQLSDSEKRFKDFATSTSDWFWEMDQNLRFSYVSDAFEKITGRPAESVLGITRVQNSSMGIEGEDWEAHLKDLNAHHSFKEFRYTIRSADGRDIHVEVSGLAVFDEIGNFLGYRGTGTDITKQVISEQRIQKAERALQKQNEALEQRILERTEELSNSKEMLRAAIENIQSGFLLVDAEGRIQVFNDKFLQLYPELKDKIAIGACLIEFFQAGAERGVYPLAINRESAWVEARIARHRTAETQFEEQLSHNRWYSIAVKQMPNGSRVGIHMDITELKEAQIAAEAATQSKSAFLANMSHEIRTPMNGIIGMSHLALQTELDEKQRNYIHRVHTSAQSLLGILNDILDFSKIESGKLDLEETPFPLKQVIDNMMNVIKYRANEKDIQIVVEKSPDIPSYLVGDPLRLGQILINLGNNAIKFSEPQSKITLSIDISHQTEECLQIHFAVADEGIGISPEQQEKLFRPFSQAETSMSRKYGGSGLGLIISKNIVELMGGSIWVESEVDRGSTFHIVVEMKQLVDEGILAIENVASEQSDKIEQCLYRLRDKRVLLVEDNEINQELVLELLESNGMVVETAENGQQALDKVAQHQYDLVLMDCQMPVMDGYQATQKIRLMKDIETLPIIALTANTMIGDREKALSVGMNDHIAKPIEPDVMFCTMAQWI